MRQDSPAPRLEVRMLGPFDVRINGESIPPLRTRKGQWLLALLALRHGRSVSRDWLAGTLWPDSLEEQGLGSLRRSLTDLRAALGSEADRLEAPTARTLRLDLTGAVVDTLRFDEAARNSDDEAELETAVSLYRGPLLEGCVDEWVLTERAEREETYLRCRIELARRSAERRDYSTAIEHYRLVILADPLREAAQRGLIEALAASGDYAAAMQTYRDLRIRLRRDYSMEPGPDTTALFQKLRREANARVNSGHHVMPKVPLPTTGTVGTVGTDTTDEEAGAEESEDSLPEPPRRLPRPLTNFVGREKELNAVCATLRTKRLLTLTGIGGIGKTRLSLACAERLLNGRAEVVGEGAYFADLAALTDPDMVLRTVAKALEVPEEVGRSLTDTLTNALRDKQILLVLDNCEHLLDACATLAVTLLQSCPRLRILATSREPLGVLGETVWRVPPMELPDAADEHAIRMAFCHEAVRLFLDRAELVQPEFLLTPERAATVVRLCQRLDGVALAIELAAARLATHTLEEIASHLDDQLHLLTIGNRGVQPRQQTLSATLDWSFALLSAEEQSLLRRLAVFAGGGTLSMIQKVCFTEETPDWVARDLMTALAKKSLVSREMAADAEEDGPDSIRYRLLEVVRQYAFERLDEVGETEPTRARHMDTVTDFVKGEFMQMNGAGYARSVARLTTETDNIRAALGWAFDPARQDDGERVLNAQRMTRAMLRVWALHNALTEAQGWCVRALASTVTIPDGLADEERAEQERVIGVERARLISYAGIIARRIGDYETAERYQEESLALARRFNDVEMISAGLGNLALIADNQGRYDDSMRFRTEGLALERARDNKRNIAQFLQNAANIASRLGDYTTGCAYMEECVGYQREEGDEEGIIWSLAGLADTLHNRLMDGQGQPGDRERRTALRTESLRRARALDDREGIVYNLAMLAQEHCEDGELPEARCRLAECLEVAAEMEGNSSMLEPVYVASVIAFHGGDAATSAKLIGASEAILGILNTRLTPKERQENDIHMADLRAALGDAAFAEAWAEGRGLSIAQAVAFARSVASPAPSRRGEKEPGIRALK